MDREQFLQQILPLVGGKANTGLCEFRGQALLLTVKDRSAVALEELRQVEGVAAAELSRSRLKITAQEQYLEELNMANNKYQALADQLPALVGGKENVVDLFHCVTRLRLTFRDKNLVKLDEIKKLPGAVGAQWQGDQLQIIIGQSVGDAYDLLCKAMGKTGGGAVDEDLGDAPKAKFSVNTVLDYVSGSITPNIPLLMAGGFIKILVILGETLGLLTADMPTHIVLSFAGDAAFYFLPIFIGVNAAKKLGASPALGMLMGAILIHPNFSGAVGAGTALNIFGLPIYPSTYASSVLPILLIVAVMAPIQKFFGKHSPDTIRSITEPFLTALVMLPLALCVLAPLGAILGNYIATGIIWMYETLGFVGVTVFAALCPLLVMTGMHSAMMPYLVTSLTTLGWEPIVLTGMIISNIDQGAAALAVSVKTKNADRRSTALGCGITAVVGGVTEPAMYGLNLPLKTPLYCAMGGTAIGAAVAGFGKAVAYAITGSAGVIGGIPVYLPGGMSNVIWMCAGILIGFVATFALTFVFYKDPEKN